MDNFRSFISFLFSLESTTNSTKFLLNSLTALRDQLKHTLIINFLIKAITIFNKILADENKSFDLILSLIEKKESGLVTYFNQHCYNLYIQRKDYKELLDNYFIVYSEGSGIYYALKFFGNKNSQKINATNFNDRLLKCFAVHNIKLFIIGGNFKQSLIDRKVIEENINCAGYQSGYFNDNEQEKILSLIIREKPEAVIVGMGVPKQEIFAAELSKHLNPAVIICVGNFLEFYFGTIKRAPKFLHDSGFEWAYRLITEPKRLYKRYLFGIPLFIYRILKAKFQNKTL